MLKTLSISLASILLSSMTLASESIISIKSNHSVTKTADQFESILNAKGLTVFTRINHQNNASSVEMELTPTEVIIFGNPKVGTPLMQCSKTVAIDLPQKALFWEDKEGQSWVSYNNPEYLKERHNIEGCDQVINKISGVLNKVTTAATK